MFGIPLAQRRQRVYEVAAEQSHWTIADMDRLPDDEWFRYELIDGTLIISEAGHWDHQRGVGNICYALDTWIRSGGLGNFTFHVGVFLSDVDFVIPDVVWYTARRLSALVGENGHLAAAPDLIAEVLDPDFEERDRVAKLRLYEKYGVREYWIADWQRQRLTVYRREGDRLWLRGTLRADEILTSPLLPGFACPVRRLVPEDDE